jgi:hypothetical protein
MRTQRIDRDASPGGVGAARRPALLHTAVPPQPVTSSTAAADAFSRDGLFIMHDVVCASDLHELRTAARNCFGEVVQALTLGDGECFGAGDGQIKFAEVMGRDGGRYDSRYGMAKPPFSSLLGRDGMLHLRAARRSTACCARR